MAEKNKNQLSEEHLLQDAAANMILKQENVHSGLAIDVNVHNRKLDLKPAF
ncbi:hypothetical protein [Chryseobacterium gambrini]|uniref:hypothetical protein n=1 Tax=Chryseobacterium gambrini TaxID=373672 RepID=UPI00158F3913|nr:hypothetical protein [Chryseobacterium gambrini]